MLIILCALRLRPHPASPHHAATMAAKQQVKRFRDPLYPKPILDRSAFEKALKATTSHYLLITSILSTNAYTKADILLWVIL